VAAELTRAATVIEAPDAEIGARQALARAGEHRLGGVDARPGGVRVQREDAAGGLARAGAELEDRSRTEAGRRRGDRVLELLVAGDLGRHLGEVRLGVPVVAGDSPPTIARSTVAR